MNSKCFSLLLVLAVVCQGAWAQSPAPSPEAKQAVPLGGVAGAALGAVTSLAQAAGPMVEALDGAVGAGGRVVANVANAATSAADAVATAGKILGGKAILGQGIKDHWLNSFALLNDIVKTTNSIAIAGTNAAVGATAVGANAVIDQLQKDAGAVAGLSLDLVNEFGKAVGAGVNAMATLAGPLARVSPIAIGFDLLHHNLQGLVQFLQGVGDITVAGPKQAALLAPFIGKFQLLNTMLTSLQGVLGGPHGQLLNTLDGALGALGAPVTPGGVTVNALSGVVGQAVNALGPFISGLTSLVG